MKRSFHCNKIFRIINTDPNILENLSSRCGQSRVSCDDMVYVQAIGVAVAATLHAYGAGNTKRELRQMSGLRRPRLPVVASGS